MNRFFLSFALAAAAALGAPALARDEGSAPIRMWNSATVVTVTGTIDAVERVEMGGDWGCVRLRVATPDGAIQVRVGPDWYVAQTKVVFAKGERVEVKGSRLKFAGEDAMVAGEIVRGADRIVLRDPAGRPAWAPQGGARSP
jgi:hypothetical protein